jgi:hypothetical protein
MFGVGPSLIALTIFVFEPNLLAHGSLVTADMGLTGCLYASVFAFYLYLEKRTRSRLALTGILAGTCLAAKHSELVVFPILAAVAVADLAVGKTDPQVGETVAPEKRFLNRAEALAFIAFVAYVVLWAFYAFRFSAQPNAEVMAHPIAKSASGFVLKTYETVFAGFFAISLIARVLSVWVQARRRNGAREADQYFFLAKCIRQGAGFIFQLFFL